MWRMRMMCFPPQPPPAYLDSLFLYIEDVIDVSSRLLSLLDQKLVQPGDPLFLQTLCKWKLLKPRGCVCYLATGSGHITAAGVAEVVVPLGRLLCSHVLLVSHSCGSSHKVLQCLQRWGRAAFSLCWHMPKEMSGR